MITGIDKARANLSNVSTAIHYAQTAPLSESGAEIARTAIRELSEFLAALDEIVGKGVPA